ncbi:MAG: hypothetical protein HOW73_32610 [Polyangiaceae bacterium]|nr:hypothetical protein [Polyangiaceae bacterium]
MGELIDSGVLCACALFSVFIEIACHEPSSGTSTGAVDTGSAADADDGVPELPSSSTRANLLLRPEPGALGPKEFPPSVPGCEKGPIRLPPPSKVEGAALTAHAAARLRLAYSDVRRNRAGLSIDSLSGAVWAPIASFASRREAALAFVRGNADLLALDASIMEALTSAATEGSGSEIALRAIVPRPGYEAFPSVDRTIRMSVRMRDPGLYDVNNPRIDPPPFNLCTSPKARLSKGDLDASIAGYVPTYRDGRGGTIDESPITKGELGDWRPTIHVDWDPKTEEFTVRLAYAQRVRGWTAFVDANDASLIQVLQNFRT